MDKVQSNNTHKEEKLAIFSSCANGVDHTNPVVILSQNLTSLVTMVSDKLYGDLRETIFAAQQYLIWVKNAAEIYSKANPDVKPLIEDWDIFPLTFAVLQHNLNQINDVKIDKNTHIYGCKDYINHCGLLIQFIVSDILMLKSFIDKTSMVVEKSKECNLTASLTRLTVCISVVQSSMESFSNYVGSFDYFLDNRLLLLSSLAKKRKLEPDQTPLTRYKSAAIIFKVVIQEVPFILLGESKPKTSDPKKGNTLKIPVGKPEFGDEDDYERTAYNELCEEWGPTHLPRKKLNNAHRIMHWNPVTAKWIIWLCVTLSPEELKGFGHNVAYLQDWPDNEKKDTFAITGRKGKAKKTSFNLGLAEWNDVEHYVQKYVNRKMKTDILLCDANNVIERDEERIPFKKLDTNGMVSNVSDSALHMPAFTLLMFGEHFDEIRNFFHN